MTKRYELIIPDLSLEDAEYIKKRIEDMLYGTDYHDISAIEIQPWTAPYPEE